MTRRQVTSRERMQGRAVAHGFRGNEIRGLQDPHAAWQILHDQRAHTTTRA
jgi:hypothetical protein